MKTENCQVCGNPIFGINNMGINVDGSLNSDFCSDCYKQGQFITRDSDLVDERDSLIVPYAAIGAIGLNGIANAPGMMVAPGYLGQLF